MVRQCTATKVGSQYSSHSVLRKIQRIDQRTVTAHSRLMLPSQWAATVRIHLSSSLKMLFCDWGLGVSSARFLLAGGLWGAGATLFTTGAGVTAVAVLVSSWNTVWEMKLELCTLTTPSTTVKDNGTSTSWSRTVHSHNAQHNCKGQWNSHFLILRCLHGHQPLVQSHVLLSF